LAPILIEAGEPPPPMRLEDGKIDRDQYLRLHPQMFAGIWSSLVPWRYPIVCRFPAAGETEAHRDFGERELFAEILAVGEQSADRGLGIAAMPSQCGGDIVQPIIVLLDVGSILYGRHGFSSPADTRLCLH
jgi:hypothetical protein